VHARHRGGCVTSVADVVATAETRDASASLRNFGAGRSESAELTMRLESG